MPPEVVPLLIAMAGLFVASGACSATETALFRLSLADRVVIEQKHPAAAAALARLLNDPRALLVTILLLNNIVNLAYFLLAALISVRAEHALGSILAGAGSLIVLILLGEITPKLVATTMRIRIATLIARPLVGIFSILSPVRRILDGYFVSPLAQLVRPVRKGDSAAMGVDELSALIQVGATRGSIDEHEEDILAGVIELGALRVRDIMTNRHEMTWLDAGSTAADVAVAIRKSGCTRIPVFRTSPDDDALGFLDGVAYFRERERLRLAGQRVDPPITSALSPARCVPENARLDQMLDLCRRSGVTIALCVDEHGSVQGVVELEDIVAQIAPAAPAASDPASRVRMIGRGHWLVPGNLAVRDWREFFESDLGRTFELDARVDTIGGLIIARLGRLPRVGDCVTIAGLRLEVAAIEGRRIDSVRITLAPGDTEPPA
ncbi:MAG: HlyC/CorC family transporter [Phycisphaeraceae bacterium]|nr:HlyC/CorC family transporter [Phycisphaeraceae bacterium]